MRRHLAVLAAVLLVTFPAQRAAGDPAFSLYLVRHAEKTSEADDPGLSRSGRKRAERLARWLSGQRIGAIWSSDYLRSRATAQPLASRLGIPIGLYDPQRLTALAGELLRRGEPALVVGHSNTTPELAALLCGCPVAPMPDTEYERLIQVTIDGAERRVQEYDQRALFGLPGAP